MCSVDADCGALACRDGACVTPPGPSLVSRCIITPEVAVLRPGGSARFWVLAWDPTGQPVVVSGGAAWSALGTALTGSGQGNDVELQAGAAGSPLSPAVEARFADVRCEARALVLADPPAGRFGVSVVDALTGRPIAGAKVLLSRADGSVIDQAGEATLDTDATGLALPASLTGLEPVSVSVFHPDFSYLTLANLHAPSGILSLALQRNPFEHFGGIAGVMSAPRDEKPVVLGRAALSRSDDLESLDPAAPPVNTTTLDVNSGWIDLRGTPVSTETIIRAGALTEAPVRFSSLGQAGTCALNGAPDEAKVAAGRCGTRAAWALAASLDLGGVPFDLVDAGFPVDVVPFLRRLDSRSFFSTVQRDVAFDLRPTPRGADGGLELSGTEGFTPLTVPFGQVPLGFAFGVQAPVAAGLDAQRTLAVGAALVPGRGVVPLGFSGWNRGNDSELVVRMAPAHHGLEGAPYALFVQRELGEWRGVSTLVSHQARLHFDELYERGIDLRDQRFLPVPTSARLNLGAGPVDGLPGRSCQLAPVATGATLARVRLTDAQATRWDTLVDPREPTFTWPEVPGALRDCLYATSNRVVGPQSRLTVELLSLEGEAGATMDFATATRRDNLAGDRALERLTAFSRFEAPAPRLRFRTPAGPLARDGRVEVLVEGPPSLSSAWVLFTFTTGSATCVESRPADLRYGVQQPLLARCTGSPLTVTAELVGADRVTPLEPPVRAAETFEVQ